MKNPNNLEVGQKVIRIYTDERRQIPPFYEYFITKIATKWVSVSNKAGGKEIYRFDKKTMLEESGVYSPCAKYYKSMTDFHDETERIELWKSILNLSRNPPSHLSLEDVRKIRKIIEYGFED